MTARLYHGTSETLAERILAEGIRPAPLGVFISANPEHVYMIETVHHAMMFGVGRVLGWMVNSASIAMTERRNTTRSFSSKSIVTFSTRRSFVQMISSVAKLLTRALSQHRP